METLGAVISVRQTGLALSRYAHAVMNTRHGRVAAAAATEAAARGMSMAFSTNEHCIWCAKGVSSGISVFRRCWGGGTDVCSKNPSPHPRMAPYVSNLASISETAPRKGESTPRKRGQDSALCIKSSDISAKDATHAGSFPFAAAREDFIQTLYQVMERVL